MSGKKRALVRKPDYFDRFRCTASACSDNCCIGWEIDIDEKTAGKYKNVPGKLGKKLQEMILWPEEPPRFILQRERCPFLDQDNLCEIIRELGEDSLCDICREHPRYYEWFDGLTEKGVGLCCEAAAGLILGSSKKAEFVTEPEERQEREPLQKGETLQEGELRDEELRDEELQDEELWNGQRQDPLLTGLLEARETAFGLIQNREIPLDERLALYLMLSEDIQDYLSMYADYRETLPQEDGGDLEAGAQAGMQTAERIREAAKEYGNPEFVTGLLKDCRESDESGNMESKKDGPGPSVSEKDGICAAAGRYRPILKFLQTLEPVSEQWPELLERLQDELTSVLAKGAEFSAYMKEREYQYEHLAVYFTYRYYLKSYFNCDLLSRAVFTVVSVLVIRLLDMEKYAGTGRVTVEEQIETVRYYSRELEYSLENLETFSEEVWEGEAFALEELLELLFM